MKAWWQLRSWGQPLHAVVGPRCSGVSKTIARIAGLPVSPCTSPVPRGSPHPPPYPPLHTEVVCWVKNSAAPQGLETPMVSMSATSAKLSDTVEYPCVPSAVQWACNCLSTNSASTWFFVRAAAGISCALLLLTTPRDRLALWLLLCAPLAGTVSLSSTLIQT